MPAIRVSEDIRSLSEFRANVAAFVEQVRRTRRPLVLTQHGRSSAVLLEVAEQERLVECAELLEGIRTAEEQVARGELVDHDAARARLLSRLGR